MLTAIIIRRMKSIFSILLIIFIWISVNGQSKKHTNYKVQIDTLSTINDSTLTRIIIYFNDTLIKEEKIAYLFPDTIVMNRFRLTGSLIKSKIPVDRVYKQGKTLEYSLDGKKKISEYKNDVLISTFYFNNNNLEISNLEYNNGYIIYGPNFGKEFLISGDKIRKKKCH
jgi:hypothetical protein